MKKGYGGEVERESSSRKTSIVDVQIASDSMREHGGSRSSSRTMVEAVQEAEILPIIAAEIQ